MKVIGLDGKQYNLQFNKHCGKCSSGHEKARILLKKIFPNDFIYEEVTLRGTKRFNKSDLYADFLIPAHRILVEVHGDQHYEQNNFFHDSKLDFIEGQKRDRRKIEWCEKNNIIYIELPDKENEDDWRRRISDGISS